MAETFPVTQLSCCIYLAVWYC